MAPLPQARWLPPAALPAVHGAPGAQALRAQQQTCGTNDEAHLGGALVHGGLHGLQLARSLDRADVALAASQSTTGLPMPRRHASVHGLQVADTSHTQWCAASCSGWWLLALHVPCQHACCAMMSMHVGPSKCNIQLHQLTHGLCVHNAQRGAGACVTSLHYAYGKNSINA